MKSISDNFATQMDTNKSFNCHCPRHLFDTLFEDNKAEYK